MNLLKLIFGYPLKFLKFLLELWATKQIERIDKRKSYSFCIRAREKLPMEVWAYLVKQRANFLCEDCGKSGKLNAHHIKPKEQGGESRLCNGKCLCENCHTQYRQNNCRMQSRFHQSLCERFGYEKGTILLQEFRRLKYKGKKEFLNRLATGLIATENWEVEEKE